MIRHSLKYMWNQKRKNLFLILELFLIFTVILLSGTYFIEKIALYMEGTGLETDHCHYLEISNSNEDWKNDPELMNRVKEAIRQVPGVEAVSMTKGASPFIFNYNGHLFAYEEKQQQLGIKQCDDQYDEVLHPNLIKGRWFEAKDTLSTIQPIVLNRLAVQKMFGDEEALGKRIRTKYQSYEIVGIIKRFKRDEYDNENAVAFLPITTSSWTSSGRTDYLIRLEEGRRFPMQGIHKAVFQILAPKEFIIHKMSSFASMKEKANQFTGNDVLTAALIIGFLVFNLFLGLMGILGYKVKQRKAEIAIRRSTGASTRSIRKMILLETYLITLMGVIPSILLVVQIPALEIFPLSWKLFLQSTGAALVIIIVMVFLSVLVPARQAAKIEPAQALKEE